MFFWYTQNDAKDRENRQKETNAMSFTAEKKQSPNNHCLKVREAN